jgi:hypothetical protein
MSWTDAYKCFFCSRPINGRHVYAVIEHHYKHGGSRESDRRFHPPCFEKFVEQGGRPYNPHTEYEVINYEEETT